MRLTGTLWRAKAVTGRGLSPTFMMGTYPVTQRPRPTYLLDSATSPQQWIAVGDVVLIGSEPVPRDEVDRGNERHQSFVKVLMPVTGYMNATYFVGDSMWFDRIA